MSLRKLMVILLIVPSICFASKWDDLWLTKDQQGMNYYNNGDAKKAAQTLKIVIGKEPLIIKLEIIKKLIKNLKKTAQQRDYIIKEIHLLNWENIARR